MLSGLLEPVLLFTLLNVFGNLNGRKKERSRDRLTDFENKCVVTKGKGWGRRGGLGDWDWQRTLLEMEWMIKKDLLSGRGICWQLQLQSDPEPGNVSMPLV